MARRVFPLPDPSRHLTLCGSAAWGAPPQTPGTIEPTGAAVNTRTGVWAEPQLWEGAGRGTARRRRQDPPNTPRGLPYGLRATPAHMLMSALRMLSGRSSGSGFQWWGSDTPGSTSSRPSKKAPTSLWERVVKEIPLSL